MRGRRGRELFPISLPSRPTPTPTRAPRPRDPSQDADYPNDVIDQKGSGLPSAGPALGVAPALLALSPLQPQLRSPITRRRYLLPQRLAVRGDLGHVPAVATAVLGHGVLAAWAAPARARGMIGGARRTAAWPRRASARLGGRGGSARSSSAAAVAAAVAAALAAEVPGAPPSADPAPTAPAAPPAAPGTAGIAPAPEKPRLGGRTPGFPSCRARACDLG